MVVLGLPVALAAVLAAAAIRAADAAAVGIAYVDGGNVQVSTVDGATKAALTSDGSATRVYQSVAHTSGGFVFASAGNGHDSLKQFIQYSPLGAKVSEYTAPYDHGGWTLHAYPLGFEVDAPKTNIAYGYSVSNFNYSSFDRGTWVAPTDHSAGSPPFERTGLEQPTFLGSRLVGVNGNQVLVQDATGTPPYSNDFTPWLAAGGTIELKRVAIAPNGTTYAIEYTDTGPEPDVTAIELHRHTGAAIPGGDDTIACDFPVAANPERVTFSPDSSLIAWKDAGGVKVARVPDLTAPGATCPPPSPPVVISTTGESPALGGIDVPALIAARAGGGGGTGGGGSDGGAGTGGGGTNGGGDGGGGAGSDRTAPGLSFASAKQLKLANALKKGVVFKLALTEACTLDADLLIPAATARKTKLKRAIGSAGAKLKAGSSSLKVKATKTAQKKLKRLRSLRLTLRGACTDAAGNAVKVNRAVTLKR